jgi:CheY-like chemotaxis protein
MMEDTRNRLSILVVDDNTDSADSLAELLACMGYDARAAYNGVQAQMMVTECTPDVVILDLLMQGMDGWELARRLRPRPSSPPFLIAMTGYQGETPRQRSSDVGIDLHLIKPVSVTTLQGVLDGFWRSLATIENH